MNDHPAAYDSPSIDVSLVLFEEIVGRDIRGAATRLLVDEFRERWPDAWPTLPEAEIDEALRPGKVAFAVRGADGALLGWIGAQPVYDGLVWELHPIVVGGAWHGRGVGRALVLRLGEELRSRGALTLVVGSDDEANLTSLGGTDLYPNVLAKLAVIENLQRYPLGFYHGVGIRGDGGHVRRERIRQARHPDG